jgi:hypothetical protein
MEWVGRWEGRCNAGELRGGSESVSEAVEDLCSRSPALVLGIWRYLTGYMCSGLPYGVGVGGSCAEKAKELEDTLDAISFWVDSLMLEYIGFS